MSEILDALQTEARLRPNDDVPRLVLADWLEEHGDETDAARAELIRIQCQLAHLRAGGRADSDLEWRERSLWWQHVETWLGPIYDASSGFHFDRGLATIDLEGDRVTDTRLETLFASPAWAWVERLNLTKARAGLLAELLHSPAVSRLSCLSIDGGEDLWRDDLGLAECGRLGSLQRLVLRRTALEERGAGMLASCPSLTGLAVLDLGHNLLHGPGLEALGQAPALGSLTTLDLMHNPLGYDGREVALQALRSFLGSPLARRLTRLGLAETALGPPGIELLAASRALSNLTDLDLSSNGIDDAAVETLADSPVLGKLKRLSLRDNALDVQGVVALTRSAQLAGLEQFDLSGNGLSTGALQALARAPNWWGLRKLRLGRQQAYHPRLFGELRARYGSALDLS
jgi:uncharacterized protein (TIGR02996 family)